MATLTALPGVTYTRAKTYNQDYNEAHLDLDLPAFTFSKLLDICAVSTDVI